ncbi:MAG: ATP-dependent DNA helicase RecG [Chloroflexi bacterium RBG_13_51_36]|nr:MAG: ATP-dependent DNA helicase RecG [Chloroflexi bacterium RBG_13_51_36]
MTGIDSLRNVLELERRKGYNDKAVIGGLDKYLHNQAGQIRQSISDRQLLKGFDGLNLAGSSYGSYSLDERKRWMADIFSWLDKATETTRGQGSGVRDQESAVSHQKAAREGPLTPPLPSRERNKTGLTVRGQGSRVTTQMAATGPRRKRREELDSPITVIKGISTGIDKKFARLNVRTICDLLYFFPRRYLDYSRTKPVSELTEGEEQTILGTIWQARVANLGSRLGTEAIVGDKTGNIRAVWFNQPYLAKRFRTNARIVLSGTVGIFKGHKVFESPEWELLGDEELIHTGRLVPVYPLTQGLYPRQVRKWTKETVDGYAWQLDDFLPSEIKARCQLLDLPTAIGQIHYPDDQTMAERARGRLSFDELFLLQLGVLAKKRDWQESQPGNAFRIDQEVISRFLSCLPFTLTRAQERVLQETLADLEKPKAMSRLLQGEVGSGKTVIATLALLLAAANGYQAALMAPTEVLAEQHYTNICNYLSQIGTQQAGPEPGQRTIRLYTGFLPKPLTIALLIGSLSGAEKQALHGGIKQGKVDIVIGTHALIQREVKFKKLGLAVIDEQHRFGVLQRSALRQKGFNPHVLVMTATPIPRTMALTLYGDLDLSVIDELPPGRQVVKTKCLEPQDREKAYTFLHRQVSNGRQAFIICPLIEESEVLEAKAAKTEYARLSREVFPDLRLGLLHGQMPGNDKEEIMRHFRSGELDILVSTSVVEVGIDVPRASVMMVEGAERFGLSQLHQFRGRVGRDKEQGYCLLIQEKLSPEARERLRLMEKVHNGFVLAEKDLELRGPGEFFGTHQSGLPDLKLAKLTDLRGLELARREAMTLFQNDPDLKKAEHQPLRQQLSRAWSKEAEWS